MRTGSQHNRIPGLIRALVFLALCIIALPALSAAAQTEPDARPDPMPFFYDPSGLYDEGQRATLDRDAKLLQSSKIPTVVYVRTASPEEGSPEAASTFADAIRSNWAIETSSGEDNGLVLLFSHVPDNPKASSVVASWGSATFEGSGLTPEYITSVLAGDVRMLLDQGHPFEALVYGMREIRYGGIYFPPLPDPLEGASKTLHSALTWLAPALVALVITTCVAISVRLKSMHSLPNQLVSKAASATGLIVAVLSILSVIGRSRIGIGSALLILTALAIHMWLWTHPTKHPSSKPRQRSVIPTSRRMRKRAHFRRMRVLPEVQR